jgi:hypothetical protein
MSVRAASVKDVTFDATTPRLSATPTSSIDNQGEARRYIPLRYRTNLLLKGEISQQDGFDDGSHMVPISGSDHANLMY